MNINTNANCGACGAPCSGEQTHANSVVDQSSGTFGTCISCGSLRVLDKIDYNALYSKRDSSNYPSAGNTILVNLKQWYLRRTAKSLVELIASPSAKILDYGCGGGEFSNAIHSLGFTSVYACDMQLDRPQTLSSDVQYSGIVDIANTGLFDIIVMRHVLEHIEYPQPILQRLACQLAPGGQILIEVPNSRSLFRKLLGSRWPGYFYPFHVHVFSEQGLSALANRCGLAVKAVTQCNSPIFGVFLMGLGIKRTYARTLSIFFYPGQCILNQLTNRQEAIRITLQKRWP
ncbi:MAG: Methyltransferase type 11 [Candidatus Gallionella acididurans]|uniref:Methyltransferase type 11 n=1 Tax=Candidatus Gallionella acididurans TaxID=1796491 RepID=A0A139BQM4_9PROT|nr:MAG: Methyltransferase type 11 [Candidatus Gallionella acididurans]